MWKIRFMAEEFFRSFQKSLLKNILLNVGEILKYAFLDYMALEFGIVQSAEGGNANELAAVFSVTTVLQIRILIRHFL